MHPILGSVIVSAELAVQRKIALQNACRCTEHVVSGSKPQATAPYAIPHRSPSGSRLRLLCAVLFGRLIGVEGSGRLVGMIRIATRGSALALVQARLVAGGLRAVGGGECELVVVSTAGDDDPDRPIHEFGGAGVFTKAVERAVLDGLADAAVHSHKDLPTEGTPGLCIAAIPERAAAGDLLLIRSAAVDRGRRPWMLRAGACVGTSSARRRAQLVERDGRAVPVDIRGNVPTRLARLRDGVVDGLIVARAGLDRLRADVSAFEAVDLLALDVLPAPAQGAMAVQCRVDDAETAEALRAIHHEVTGTAVAAERGLLALVQGGCSVALGCLATVSAEGVSMRAYLHRDGIARRCVVEGGSAEDVAGAALLALTR